LFKKKNKGLGFIFCKKLNINHKIAFLLLKQLKNSLSEPEKNKFVLNSKKKKIYLIFRNYNKFETNF
jgi:hypothetical protein